MAIKTISKVTVSPDGWDLYVTIASLNIGGTHVYDFGSLDDTPATITAPTFVIDVVSEGYNSLGVLGTINRRLYGTHVVRKPHPNQASKDEDDSTADMVVRVAMGECIYNDDRNYGAGTSGVNPVVNINAGWFSNGTDTTSALVNYEIPTTDNLSTLDYPKVIAQWAFGHTPFYKRVENDFTIGCITYHGHDIACVELKAVGVTSSFETTAKISSVSKHLMSATNLNYESYDLPVSINDYTQGETINLNFIAYPLVGDLDSVVDTTGLVSIPDDPRGLTQMTCVCDKTTAMRDYAIVVNRADDAVGSKSTVLATAELDPFANIGRALASGANIIYVKTGTHPILGREPTVPVKNYWIEVKPYPGHSVVLTRDLTYRTYGATKLAFIDFPSITSPGGYTYLSGTAGRSLMFNNCHFVNAAFADAGLAYGTPACWFINSSITGLEKLTTFGGSFAGIHATGLYLTSFSAEAFIQSYGMVACKSNTTSYRITVVDISPANPGPVSNNDLVINNYLVSNNINGGNAVIHRGDSSTLRPLINCAIVGNVIEVKSVGTSGPALWVGADGRVNPIRNVIVAHNTVVGQRANLFYNDIGTVANVTENIFFRNNVINGFAIKSDTFTHPVNGTQTGRVGNWVCMNGVNCSDNRYTYQASLWGFNQNYYGINVQYEDMSANITNEMGFTDDNSTYGDGTGNGNYLPTISSVLFNQPLLKTYQKYDLNGIRLK